MYDSSLCLRMFTNPYTGTIVDTVAIAYFVWILDCWSLGCWFKLHSRPGLKLEVQYSASISIVLVATRFVSRLKLLVIRAS
jgi:hypothetical protein